MGLLLKPDVTTSMPHIDALTWFGFVHNMIPVIASNLVGGSVLVGLVYYVIYRRKSAQAQDEK